MLTIPFHCQWSIVDSPILFNCGSNHVHAEELDTVVVDEDIDIGKVSHNNLGPADPVSALRI